MSFRVLLCSAALAAGLAPSLAEAPALAAEPDAAERTTSAVPADLSERVTALARSFDGDVGIAIKDLRDGWTFEWNGDRRFPQQSVAKLWTATAVLQAIDDGRLRLDDPVTVTRADLSVFNEPLAARLRGGAYQTDLRELLALAIVESDNAANDVLVRRLGGRAVVQAVIDRKGLTGIAAGIQQRELQSRIAGLDWRPEYGGGRRFEAARAQAPAAAREAAMQSYLAAPDDGATPAATVQALQALQAGRLLSRPSTALLLSLMRQSEHGPDRLAGGLEPGWSIAHKTGTGQHLGLLHVGTNDVGVLTAPDGHAYAVAVYIGRSIRPLSWREGLMRNVARAIVAHWKMQTNRMTPPANPG